MFLGQEHEWICFVRNPGHGSGATPGILNCQCVPMCTRDGAAVHVYDSFVCVISFTTEVWVSSLEIWKACKSKTMYIDNSSHKKLTSGRLFNRGNTFYFSIAESTSWWMYRRECGKIYVTLYIIDHKLYRQSTLAESMVDWIPMSLSWTSCCV